ncbi:MAG TPA: M48 family peptidase, partial [Anaerolineales bacterium]|nr:M48 family peptidase [Anaerolineales bacterium]
IVHELCHLREQNHSKKFWAQVAAILPDYKERRKWLKENSARLTW